MSIFDSMTTFNEYKNKISNIYNHLQDKESKLFFTRRLLFSITGSGEFLTEMIMSMEETKEIGRIIKQCEIIMDKLVVYGTGKDFQIVRRLWPDFRPKIICDKDRKKGDGEKECRFQMKLL